MQFELKTLSPEALPAALEKARLYRLLNEPTEAESICRDVLEVDPGNQDAVIMLLLALTDQFDTEGASAAVADAGTLLERLSDPYTRVLHGHHVRRTGEGAASPQHAGTRAADLRMAA